MKKSNIIKLVTAVITASLLFTACGKKSTSTTAASTSNPKTVIVAIANGYKPYAYLDDKGQLVGYEVDVLKAINKKLPQYKFEFNQLDFKDLLLSVQTGKADIGACQVEKNPEREKLFSYASTPIDVYNLRLVTKKGRTDFKSFDDLKGKVVQTQAGGNAAYVLDTYNKAHNNEFKLVYSSDDNATLISNLASGKYDATLMLKRDVEANNKAFGDKLQIVGDVFSSSSAYHIFYNKDTQLKADYDKALKELKADGTLAKLSIQWIGGDFTNND